MIDMSKKIFSVSFLLCFLVSINAFAQTTSINTPLQQFKGVPVNTKDTEATLEDPIEKDNFCCHRQVKTGDAHAPRYNIRDLLEPKEDSDTSPTPFSSGKK